MRKNKRLMGLGLILLVVLLGLVIIEIGLPIYATEHLRESLKSSIEAEQINAKVTGKPALRMLSGSFDTVSAEATNVKLDKFKLTRLEATLTDIELNKNSLYTEHKVVLEKVKDVNIIAIITQNDLANYINTSVKGAKNTSVTIESGKVNITTNLALGSFGPIVIGVEGQVVTDGQKVKFVTQKAQLNNSFFADLSGLAITEIPLFDAKKLPFSTRIKEISQTNGIVTIKADNMIQ